MNHRQGREEVFGFHNTLLSGNAIIYFKLNEERNRHENKNDKSVFGLEKGTVNILAKIFIAVLIIGIIILFRFRTKNRTGNRKVIRRFPGIK